MRLRHQIAFGVVALLPLTAGTTSQATINGGTVGLDCADTTTPDGNPYQSNWKHNLTNFSSVCDNLASELWTNNEGTLSWRFNLQGSQPYWETTSDSQPGGVDTVNLFFSATHGQAAPHDYWAAGTPPDSNYEATWSMWDYQTSARSMYMRLGDGKPGTSIFATYSCETMLFDGYTWDRYGPLFRGGLRVAAGADGDISWCNTSAQQQTGSTFMWYLGQGYLIIDAWGNAFVGSGCPNQPPSIMFTGTSESNCVYRRENMTWANYSSSSFPQLKDSQITTWCGWQWNGI